MGVITMKAPFGAADIIIETGKLAKQTSSVIVTQGETKVLVTCTGGSARPGTDFLPLSVEYSCRNYSYGRIPGGYLKREGRASSSEVLISRVIDRSLRPLFNKNWRGDIQIIAQTISFDNVHNPDILAMLGASAASCISPLPFDGPCAGCRVILSPEGEYIINPTYAQQEDCLLDLIVAATEDAVLMVEGEGKEVSEDQMLDAIFAAHEAIKPIVKLQNQFAKKVGVEKLEAPQSFIDSTLYSRVVDLSIEDLDASLPCANKTERKANLKAITKSVISTILEEDASYVGREDEISKYVDDVYRNIIRTRTVETQERLDGRRLDEIRPIWCEIDPLPRAHGSAIFTRGETQAMASLTLGGKRDEQRIDAPTGEYFEHLLLHYNFPPFCTGEAKPLRGTSRREIGHGNLAWRGIKAIVKNHEEFPYTIRLVSEVLESNGSSSMATVCSSSLALMAGGVPVTKQVAGIAMGLIQLEDENFAVLSDILGDEDHLGDMDFKVVGTGGADSGITAIQMDIKIKGLKRSILEQALEQARKGRLHILKEMNKCIKKPRKELSPYAPQIVHVQVSPDRVRDVIGPGGKMIRSLSSESGASIEVADDGIVTISGVGESVNKAKFLIEQLTQEPEAGQDYPGVIRSIVDFGLFVEIIPGTEGLLHISEIGTPRGSDLNDFFEVGDEINVRCTEVNNGKIRLTIKDVDNGDQFDNIQSQSGPKAEVGGTYNGSVKRVMDYGVFVSFAGTDGLAHHSRIHGIARHEIASTFAEGDDVEVTVQEISNGKISLSIGEPEEADEEIKPERPARARKERKERDERPARKERKPRKEPEVQEEYDDAEDLEISVGKVVLGTVTNIKAYGCFVELAEGVTGLVHLEELADYPFDNIEEVVEIGDEIYVKVVHISRDGKIRLSRKEAVNED